ncbi:MAG: hypothetical protein Q8M98_10720 [Candidatus Cloacimonadaceae bacterium]|nr:hypothetical protein [Candidatus Cloacimonadaceae bacterium]MDP3115227.1 hypothetical protein [Candidatus Cloacimonadaceae bacterium]
MKQVLIAIAIMILVSTLPAHPAGSVTARFDATTKLLSISFDHSVKDPTDHFIKSIIVKVGGSIMITQNLNIQENAAGGSFSYKLLNLKKGDVIEVITECNKSGKKFTKLTPG